jgi:hypothetical protein
MLWSNPALEPPPNASLLFGSEIRHLLHDKPKLLSGLDEVERNAASYVREYCVASDMPGHTELKRLKGTLLPALATHLASLQGTYGRRLATCYVDAIDAIGRRRLHLAALALRAYMELCGALVYFEQRIGKCLTRGIATQAELDELMELFRTAINGGRFQWEAFHLGGEAIEDLKSRYAAATSTEKEPVTVQRQKSTAAFIAALDASLAAIASRHKGAVKMGYALLSDTCHPSVGGDMWFADIPQVAGRIRHRAAPHDEMMRDFIHRVALPVMIDNTRIAIRSLNRISGYAEALTEKGQSGSAIRLEYG